MENKVKKIMVVSNTHWDREFRFSFEKTRHNLVRMLDTTIDILDSDPSYHSFTMDGHTIMIEDYLEIRPERTEQVKRLISEGRLIIGPYYTLPEEYSLGHESLVRNLIYGRKIMNKYGAKHSTVAYTPASWGQTGQYPQILADFGMNKMMFYRGVSHDEADAEYIWQGVDGTKMYASRFALYCRYNWYYQVHRAATRNRVWGKDYIWGEYADTPYTRISGTVAGDASYDLKTPQIKFNEDVVKKAVLDMLKEEDGHFTTPIFLAMNGHDISVAAPSDTKLVKAVKDAFEGEIEVEQTDLEHFWEEAVPYIDNNPNIKTLVGERRSYLKKGKWTYLMPSTISSRTYLKQQDFAAYNNLTYKAEPIASISKAILGDDRKNYLNRGWQFLLSNHTHDANGGCAPDCVCVDMEYRYRKANDCADIVFDDSLADIAKNIDGNDLPNDAMQMIVYNSLPFKRDVIVRVTADLPEKFKNGFGGKDIEIQLLSSNKSSIFMDSIWEVPTIMDSEHFVAYIKVKDVPACGYKVITLEPAEIRQNKAISDGKTLENEYLKVSFNKNGTVNVTDKESGKEYKNVNYLSSQGEIGNAWNHKSPKEDKLFTSVDSIAEIKCIENGELSASFEVNYTFNVPKDCIETQNTELVSIPVTVVYTLQKDSKALGVKVKLNNTAKDHWLRANFPTDIKAEYSYTDSHFDVMKRPVKVPDSTGWVETAYGMQPLRTFAAVEDEKGGFAVMPKGLYEYEVFEDKENRMALTLIRGCRIRQQVSEEKITLLDDEGILCLGEREFEYSLYFYHCDKSELCNEAAKIYAEPQIALFGKSYGKLPKEASFVSVDNNKVHVSAIKPSEDGKGVIIRFFNPTDEVQNVNFKFGTEYKKLCLAGMDEAVKGEIKPEIEAGPKKIITVYAEF